MDNCSPIGFFDSGVGGISVLKTAYKLLPRENYIYYGDSKNAPYGEKTEEQINELTLNAAKVLVRAGVKAIVLACNTATSVSVLNMRKEYNIPVISMEPAVKPALEVGGKVLVLATPATVSQSRYNRLLEKLDAGDKVINVGCSGLVELIETGKMDEKSINDYLSRKLSFVKDETINSVVIGCTHYSFIENKIVEYIEKNHGENCKVFDGRFGTVKQLQRILQSNDMLCDSVAEGKVEFITSGEKSLVEAYKQLFETF